LPVAFWNIERGLGLDDIQPFIQNKDAFMAKVQEKRNKAKESGKRSRDVDLEKIPEEIEILRVADVWILNEVDWGVKRTKYREVVLSRYPIRSARVVPFTVGYDWFKESKIRPLEKGKRQVSKLVGKT
jgi:hypothetical protein